MFEVDKISFVQDGIPRLEIVFKTFSSLFVPRRHFIELKK